MHRPRIYGQHKKAPLGRKKELCNILAPQFQRCQFSFCLNALVVVKIDIGIDQSLGLGTSGRLAPVNTLSFENREKVFGQSVVVRVPPS